MAELVGLRPVDDAAHSFDSALARQIARQAEAGPPGLVAVHRWYLRRAPAPLAAAEWPEDAQLITTEQPPTPYYRFLYRAVGEAWAWSDCLMMSDEALTDYITRPGMSVTVLFIGGAPMGYFQLDRGLETGEVEIAYFGLMSWAIGRKLGPNLLRAAVSAAGGDAAPVIVNTCTLDHPKALRTYQGAGFVIDRQIEFFEPDPRLAGDIRLDASPHMPLQSRIADGA